MTLKEEGCSERQITVTLGCSQPVTHSAVSYSTKLGTYRDKTREGRPRKTLTDDESMLQ